MRRLSASITILALSAGLMGVASSGATATPAAGPDPAPALAGYFTAADTQRTSGAAAASRSVAGTSSPAMQSYANTDAAAAATTSASKDVEAFTVASLTITSSQTTADNVVTITRSARRSVVEALVTTTVTSVAPDGQVITSSWSDTHRITLATSAGAMRVTQDKVLPAPTAVEPDGGTPAVQPDPAERSSAEPLTADTPTVTALAASVTQPAIDTTAFRNYALKWTSYPYTNSMNPAYPTLNPNCANFASQVLDNAGWNTINGVALPSNANYWSPNLFGLPGSTYTWGSSKYLYPFVHSKVGWLALGNIWNAKRGDLLFVDWDPNGRADGTIDHAMVVSDHIVGVYAGHPNMPMISQKSNNRSNIPLSQSIKLAQDSGVTSMVWYGLVHR